MTWDCQRRKILDFFLKAAAGYCMIPHGIPGAAGRLERNLDMFRKARVEDIDRISEIYEEILLEEEAGAGVTINPVAFLVIQPDNVKLMPVDHQSCIDRLIDLYRGKG